MEAAGAAEMRGKDYVAGMLNDRVYNLTEGLAGGTPKISRRWLGLAKRSI
jgi:hypothetical protein